MLIDSILKSRGIILLTKVHIVITMVFPAVTYRCESWTIKMAECIKIDALELWCWKRLLRVLWTARRSNQSILKEINAEYSLEGLMLKLQYFGHWCEEPTYWKRRMLGKIEGKRRRVWQRMTWLDSITGSVDINLSNHREGEENRWGWLAAVPEVAKSQAQLRGWTTAKTFHCIMYHIFIHSSVNGHLACFHILVTVNHAIRSLRLHVSFWIRVFVFVLFFRYIPRSGIAGSCWF